MNAYSTSLAVLAGSGDTEKKVFELKYAILHGTAFCLAPNLFLTAAHVFNDARADGEVAIARLTPGNFQIQMVNDYEVFDGIDLALLHCPNLTADILPFNFNPLNFFMDVGTVGYPFGLERPNYYLRAFKGHVVTRRRLKSLPDEPPGYELSFIPPPGLSGAPLLIQSPDGTTAITGMVLQHYITEYRDRRMELGLALDIQELLALSSRLLNGKISEKIFKCAPLVRDRKS